MRNISFAAACAAALALTVAPATVRAQGMPGGAPQTPQFGVNPQIKKDLNITAAQEAKIKSLQQKYFTQAQTLSGQAQTLRQQMQQEQEAVLSAAQKQKMKDIATKYQTKMQALQSQVAAMQSQANKDMDSVLTAAQKAKIKQLQAARMGGAKP